MAWETCLSRKDLLGLTWEEINPKDEIIELKNARAKTDAEQAIPIVTAELKAVIAELPAERRKLPNADGLVLTVDGRPIEKLQFEYQCRRALKTRRRQKFHLSYFRRCAITRCARMLAFQQPRRWCGRA